MATLKLGSISTIDDGVKIGNIMLGHDVIGASVTVAADTAKSITLNADKNHNYGSLNIDKDGNLSLRVSSSLDNEVEIANSDPEGAAAKLTSVSFASTKGVQTTLDTSTFTALKTATFGSGKDSVSVTGNLSEDFVLNTGAGKDVISLSAGDVHEDAKIIAGAGDDIVILEKGKYNNVALGAGKDTVQFTGNATVKLTDYKYTEDVIAVDDEAELTNDGTLKMGSGKNSVVSGIAASNNLYLAKVGTANTTMYATAAEDSAKVDVNASSVKDKNVIIDTTSADSATITTGKATLTSVSLNSSDDVVNTIKIGDASAKNSVAVTGFDGDDVLSFAGLSFAKTTIGLDGGEVTLTNGKVSVNLGDKVTVNAASSASSASDVVAKFKLNDKTLYATTDAGQVVDLTEEEDITKVLVAGQNDATVLSGIKTSAQLVDLRSTNFHNINNVVLSADTAAKASVIGTKNTKTGVTINASDAADGVAVWANNSSTSQIDVITFGGSNDVADTLWLGSNDGKDSVTGFDYESDILYLADATSMKVEDGTIKVGKSKMTVDAAAAADEIMQVQGAKFAGTVYAAGDFDGDDKVELGENAGKANYYAVGKKAEVEISANMSDTYTFLKDINYAGASKANVAAGGSVARIDASDTTEDAKVIIEGVANVATGAGTNEVWVNGAASTGNVVLGTGSDKVWFGASDKTVNVNSYNAESDVIALIGNTMDFKAKKDSASGKIVITTGTSKLKVDTTSDFVNLVDSTGAAYKLYAGASTDSANYSTNTDSRSIFVGVGTLTSDGTVEDNTTLVLNGANNKWGLQSAAVVDKSVKTIDMSGSSADFTLVGSSTVNNTITGGNGTNYLNGGGASKDTLNGVTGAVDNFFFGKGDGDDTLVNVEADDFVQLYDVASADLASVKADDPSKVVITLNDKSKLTINGLEDGATFVLTDGVYSYDSSAEGKFVKM